MDGWIQIGKVQVDLEGLRALAHACDPMTCRHTKCCCRSYEVPVERNEIDRIVGSVPDAAKLAPALIEDDTFIDPVETSEGQFCLNTDEHGQCVFAYPTAKGAIRCAMHSLALQWNLPPESVKPKACSLWPLAIHGTNPAQLSVQSDAFEFPCNSLRKNPAPALDTGVADIIEAVFGRPFLNAVQAAIQQPK